MRYGCLGTSALGGTRCNSRSSQDSIGLVLLWFFKKEILGCETQAVWPTLKSSLLLHMCEAGLSLPFL